MTTENEPEDRRPTRPDDKKRFEETVDQPGSSQCRLGEVWYSEGTVQIVDGRPATCTAGHWIGIGDDPPRHPRQFPGENPKDSLE